MKEKDDTRDKGTRTKHIKGVIMRFESGEITEK
jgi:hypothetical protein